MMITALVRLDRNARRLREIVGVLARYGLADWLAALDVKWLSALLGGKRRDLTGLSHDERIRCALTELGTTFIKFGQVLSMRPDLVGRPLADELTKLREQVPPDPASSIVATIERELGGKLDDHFAEFDPTPLATASIAQVHAVRLHNGGSAVVKVVRSGVEERVAVDLDLLIALAEFAQKHSDTLRRYRPLSIAREFRRTLLRELDFLRERDHLERFARAFEDEPNVHFPVPYRDLTSRRVLTMERLEGVRLTDRAGVEATTADPAEIAKRGADLYLRMIFRDGFYHADPHGGNVLLMPDNRIGVIDCGMVGHIDDRLREEIELALLAIVEDDSLALADVVARIGSVPQKIDHDGLQRDFAELIADHVGRSADDTDVAEAINGLLDIVHRYQVVLPSPLALLLRVLVMLEGLSRTLNPQFCLADLIDGYARSAVTRQFSLRGTVRRVRRARRDWQRLLGMLPRDAGEILRGLRRGAFELHLEHHELESTVNRLVQGLLSAALFLGSSLLLSQRVPPLLGDLSVFGALGCLVAIWLFTRLFREIRRMKRADR